MESALAHIAENVKSLRKKKNLSIERLAALARINYKTIQRLENQQGSPSWVTVQLLAEALSVDPFDLARPQLGKK